MKSASKPQLKTQVNIPPVVRRRRWVSLSTVHSVGSGLEGLASKRAFFLAFGFRGARTALQGASFCRNQRALGLDPLTFATFLLPWSDFCGSNPLSQAKSKSFRTSGRGSNKSTTCVAPDGSLHCTTYKISTPWPSSSSFSSVPRTASWSAMMWSLWDKRRQTEQC